jgi:hypothetical protein
MFMNLHVCIQSHLEGYDFNTHVSALPTVSPQFFVAEEIPVQDGTTELEC